MSFLAPKPPGIGDQAPERTPYDFSGPLPVLHGRARIGFAHVEHPWGERTERTGSNFPDAVYYSLTGWLCHGPVDRLIRIFINGKPARDFHVNRGAADFVEYTLPWVDGKHTPIVFRLYWGSINQAACPLLTGTAAKIGSVDRPAAPHIHPPYAGICYAVFYSLDMGWPTNPRDGGGQIPQIEFELYKRPDVIQVSTDHHDVGVSAIGTLYDYFKHPVYGLSLPDSVVPPAAWTAKAHQMRDEGYHIVPGSQSGLNPVIADSQDISRHLADVMSYYDGFLRSADGVILPDYFPNKGTVTPEHYPTINRDDLIEEPEIEGGDSEDPLSEVTVTYRDRGQFLEEDTIGERAPLAVVATGEPKSAQIKAPAIINGFPALALALRALAGSDPIRIRLPAVHRRACRNLDGSALKPGDLFNFDYSPTELDLVCRVIEREELSFGRVRLVIEAEHGQYPTDYVPEADAITPPDDPLPADISHWRVLHAPADLVAGGGASWESILILAQRENDHTSRAEVWLSENGLFAGEEQQLADLRSFAVRGTLLTALTDSSSQVHFSLGNADSDLSESFSAAEQADNAMLLLIGDEWLSLGAFVAGGTSPDARTYAAARGRLGSAAAAHALGTEVWIVRRSTVQTFDHHLLRAYGTTLHLRLYPWSAWERGNPSATKTYTVPSFLPVFNPITVSGAEFTMTWSPTQQFRRFWISWWPTHNFKKVEGRWVDASHGIFAATVGLVGDYHIQIWAEIAGGNHWRGPLVLETNIAIGLAPPTGVSISSTHTGRITVNFDATNFWTFVQIYGYGDGQWRNDWAPPGETSFTFFGLPHQDYSAVVWKKSFSGEISAKYIQPEAQKIKPAAVTKPTGLAVQSIGNSKIRVSWNPLTEPWLNIDYWQGNYYQTVQTHTVAVPWATLHYVDIAVPRGGTWFVNAYSINAAGQFSEWSLAAGNNLPVSVPTNTGLFDIAERKAVYSEVSGPKPPSNADNTAERINNNELTILQNGFNITGTGGDAYVRSVATGFSTPPSTPGFFLGRKGGVPGFLVGNTSDFLRYDPGATYPLTLQMGTGSDQLLVRAGLFQLGSGNARVSILNPGIGFVPRIEVESTSNSKKTSMSVNGFYVEDGSDNAFLRADGVHIKTRHVLRENGLLYTNHSGTMRLRVGLDGFYSQNGTLLLTDPQTGYGTFTPAGGPDRSGGNSSDPNLTLPILARKYYTLLNDLKAGRLPR